MAGTGLTKTPLSQRSREQIVEAELSWISTLVLFFSTVYMVLKFDILWVAFGIAALSLYVLPVISMRDPFRALPWEMALLLSAPMLLHVSEGSRTLMEHVGWWNDMTSLAFAFSLTTIGLLLTVEFQMYTDVRMNRPFAVFFVVMFTMAMGVLWEIMEFANDSIAHSRLQYGLTDTMVDLLFDGFAGFFVAIVGVHYLVRVSPEHFVDSLDVEHARRRFSEFITRRRKAA